MMILLFFISQQTGPSTSSTLHLTSSRHVLQQNLSSWRLLMQHPDFCSSADPQMCSTPGLGHIGIRTTKPKKCLNLKQHDSAKVVVTRSPVQHHWVHQPLHSGSIGELHLKWKNREVCRGRQVCGRNYWNVLLLVSFSVLLPFLDRSIPASKLAQSQGCRFQLP